MGLFCCCRSRRGQRKRESEAQDQTRLLLLAACHASVAAPVKIREDPATPEPLLVPEGYRDLANVTALIRSWQVKQKQHWQGSHQSALFASTV